MASVHVRGVTQVLAKLDKLDRRDVAETAVKRSCVIVEHAAKENCPHDNGFLKSNITHSVNSEGDNIVGIVSANEDYAVYVEFGTGIYAEKGNGRKDVPWVYCDAKGNFHSTVGQHPQPFLRPALENNKGKIESVLRKAVNDKIREVCND